MSTSGASLAPPFLGASQLVGAGVALRGRPGALLALAVLGAWLLTNLFLGSQVCWVLRPFLWDPAPPAKRLSSPFCLRIST